MKVRIYSPRVPYPATDGAAQVIFDQARVLVTLGHEVELVSWEGPDFEARLWPLRTVLTRYWGTQSRVDAIGVRIPRMLAGGDASPELQHYPLRTDHRDRLSPADVGIYHYSFAYPWLARKQCRPEHRVFVHLHNIESDLYAQRAAAATNSFAAWVHGKNAQRLSLHERSLPSLVDEVWFLSQQDLRSYTERYAPHQTRLVPPTYDPAIWQSSRTITGDVGFVGALDFRPNEVSVQWIVDHLGPELNAAGFSKSVLVAGRNPSMQLVRAAKRYPFIRFLGFVPDLTQFWQSVRCTLSPHLEGSGVRTKLLESVARGVPAIANSAAVEMLPASLHENAGIYVCNSPAQWVDYILGRVSGVRVPTFPPAVDGRSVYEFLGN